MSTKKLHAHLFGFRPGTFESQIALEVGKCLEIVKSHSADGENTLVSIPNMFPHGIQDISYEIYKKIMRFLGYSASGNRSKSIEELQDIVNYALFGLAYLSLDLDDSRSK